MSLFVFVNTAIVANLVKRIGVIDRRTAFDAKFGRIWASSFVTNKPVYNEHFALIAESFGHFNPHPIDDRRVRRKDCPPGTIARYGQVRRLFSPFDDVQRPLKPLPKLPSNLRYRGMIAARNWRYLIPILQNRIPRKKLAGYKFLSPHLTKARLSPWCLIPQIKSPNFWRWAKYWIDLSGPFNLLDSINCHRQKTIGLIMESQLKGQIYFADPGVIRFVGAIFDRFLSFLDSVEKFLFNPHCFCNHQNLQ